MKWIKLFFWRRRLWATFKLLNGSECPHAKRLLFSVVGEIERELFTHNPRRIQ